MKAPTLTTRSTCEICGTPMRCTWTEGLSDFRWRAEDGSITGIAGDVPAGAPTSVPQLLDLLAEQADRGDMSSMAAYSMLLARYQLGKVDLPWEHLHRAIEPVSQIALEDVPTCHGWPMRAAPGAWICRVDGTITRTEAP